MSLTKKAFLLLIVIVFNLIYSQSAWAQKKVTPVKKSPVKMALEKALPANVNPKVAPKVVMSKVNPVLTAPLVPAATSQTPAKATSVVTATVKKVVAKTSSAFELGTSYNMWNERLVVSSGAVTTEGFANYAGFGINLEKNWTTGRWFRGVTLGYAFGKTSSGGFDTTPTFADGINRSWQATQASVFSLYRFDTTFSGGVGLLVRQRDADWIPKDLTLTVKPSANTQVAGQLLMRWQVIRRVAFLQGYTFLNFDGSTMWTWAAQFSL